MLPCCKPRQTAIHLNQLMGREPGQENDVVEICQVLSEFLREIIKIHQPDLQQRLEGRGIAGQDRENIANIACRTLPTAIAQMNPCMIVQLLLQLVALLFGNQARDNLSKNVAALYHQAGKQTFCDGDPPGDVTEIPNESIELALRFLLMFLAGGDKQLPPLPPIDPPGPGTGYNPSDRNRC